MKAIFCYALFALVILSIAVGVPLIQSDPRPSSSCQADKLAANAECDSLEAPEPSPATPEPTPTLAPPRPASQSVAEPSVERQSRGQVIYVTVQAEAEGQAER